MYVPYLLGIKMIKTSQNIEFYFWTKFSSDKSFVTSEKFRHFCPTIFLSDKVTHTGLVKFVSYLVNLEMSFKFVILLQ